MRAWVVEHPGPIENRPLRLVERAFPEPGPGEIRVRIATCGVCRTDLHLAEGDLPPHQPAVVPGHEVVGYVDGRGPGATRFTEGTRVGIPWLRHTCGVCRFCAPASSATGRCGAPSSHRAAGSASTGSAAPRTSPPRWRCTRERGCTSS